MSSTKWFKAITVACLVILLYGCGPARIYEMPDNFKNGTLVLAELEMIYTRSDILNGLSGHFNIINGWYDDLVSYGYQDSDIVDGSEVMAVSYCYGFNSGVPICRHSGLYMAHVTPELRGQLAPRVGDHHGDLVEIELKTSASNNLIGTVTNIYRKHDNWQGCKIRYLKTKIPSASWLAGPPRGYWIDCDELESDGWEKRILGPGVYEWKKQPVKR